MELFHPTHDGMDPSIGSMGLYGIFTYMSSQVDFYGQLVEILGCPSGTS